MMPMQPDDGSTPAILLSDPGPAPEAQIARDLIRRGIWVAPLLVAFGLLWGWGGALSSLAGLAIVGLNFALAAAMLAGAARISLGLLMGAALGGFFVRMSIVALAVLVVLRQPWAEVVPLCATLVVAHLGLLAWETRYVSASLAFPGLRPAKERR